MTLRHRLANPNRLLVLVLIRRLIFPGGNARPTAFRRQFRVLQRQIEARRAEIVDGPVSVPHAPQIPNQIVLPTDGRAFGDVVDVLEFNRVRKTR